MARRARAGAESTLASIGPLEPQISTGAYLEAFEDLRKRSARATSTRQT
jgi:hypothetical protein